MFAAIDLLLPLLADEPKSSGLMVWLPPILLIAFIWIFLVMIPSKEKKKKAQLLSTLKKGDTVLVQAGCIGKVRDVKDDYITLEFDGARIKFLRDTVVSVVDKKKPE